MLGELGDVLPAAVREFDVDSFYEGLGASVQREWLTVRLEGEALRKLASEG